jgi:hypothetical protein
MCKKTAAAALHFILNRPTLLLIIVLGVYAAFTGPKLPPIFQGEELPAPKAGSATSARFRVPSTHPSHCPTPIGLNEEDWTGPHYMTPPRFPAFEDVEGPCDRYPPTGRAPN